VKANARWMPPSTNSMRAEMLQVGHTTASGSATALVRRNHQLDGPKARDGWHIACLTSQSRIGLDHQLADVPVPDTLHNGTVSTPTPTTTAPPAPPNRRRCGDHRATLDEVATARKPARHRRTGFVDYSAARCDPGSTPAVMQRTTQSVLVSVKSGLRTITTAVFGSSDSASIELANAVRSSDGFDVTNRSTGNRYQIRPPASQSRRRAVRCSQSQRSNTQPGDSMKQRAPAGGRKRVNLRLVQRSDHLHRSLTPAVALGVRSQYGEDCGGHVPSGRCHEIVKVDTEHSAVAKFARPKRVAA